MYRLTIQQTYPLETYIVENRETLDEITEFLQAYKNVLKKNNHEQFFVDYDLIQYDDILEYSNTLSDVTFPELKEEGYV